MTLLGLFSPFKEVTAVTKKCHLVRSVCHVANCKHTLMVMDGASYRLAEGSVARVTLLGVLFYFLILGHTR